MGCVERSTEDPATVEVMFTCPAPLVITPLWVKLPPTVIPSVPPPVIVTPPSSRALTSVTATLAPEACATSVTASVKLLFCVSEILPAVAVTLVVPGTTNAPVCVTLPPAFTVNPPVRVEAAKAMPLISLMAASLTEEKERLPKSLLEFSSLTSLPDALKTVKAARGVVISNAPKPKLWVMSPPAVKFTLVPTIPVTVTVKSSLKFRAPELARNTFPAVLKPPLLTTP